ncbi:zinc-binding dehydrogenase [Streptosporangium algeriense]|uniref:Zinc-binding dehydrogenase n=1 Tax=Streptosporangium algeriense TaxID=1682748 RepID=A0ABW3DM77_9ACTN
MLVIDPVESKHEPALRLGATHAVTPDRLSDAVRTITGGRGFDYGFEAVGGSAAIMTAWKATRRGGDVIVVGAGAADDLVPLSAFNLLFEGKNILSSLYGGADVRKDFPLLAELHKTGRLDLEGMISSRISLSDLNEAVTALRTGEPLRQIVLMD